MIKANQKIFNGVLVLLDAVVCAAAMVCAYALRFWNYGAGFHLGLDSYWRLLAAALPAYALIYRAFGLHDSFRCKGFLVEAGKIIQANLAGLAFLLVLGFLTREVELSRMVLGLFFLLATAGSCLMRYLLRRALRRMRARGRNLKHFLIVGWNDMAEEFCRRVISNKSLGCYIDAYLGEGLPGEGLSFLPRAGGLGDLEGYLAGHTLDQVVFCLEYEEYPRLGRMLEVCEKYGVKSSLLPACSRYLPARPRAQVVQGMPLINLRHIPLDDALNRVLKRGVDIAVSLAGLVLLSPLMLAVAALVKLTSPGPVFYRQERVGLCRRTFTMYKFRSMAVDTSGGDQTAWSRAADSRRTPVGAVLRKLSLDELPQLWNVLRGDMSIVGPRPELPHFVEKFREEVPMYMLKHLVRPGITGWAQVKGWRGDTSIVERIRCDLWYIENWTLLLDLKIMAMTAFAMVNRRETLAGAGKGREGSRAR